MGVMVTMCSGLCGYEHMKVCGAGSVVMVCVGGVDMMVSDW